MKYFRTLHPDEFISVNDTLDLSSYYFEFRDFAWELMRENDNEDDSEECNYILAFACDHRIENETPDTKPVTLPSLIAYANRVMFSVRGYVAEQFAYELVELPAPLILSLVRFHTRDELTDLVMSGDVTPSLLDVLDLPPTAPASLELPSLHLQFF